MAPVSARNKKLVAMLRVAVLPIAVTVALVVAWKLGYFEMDRRLRLLDTVQRLRVLDGIQAWFVLTYAVVITLCVPASIATVLGGAIFGPLVGAALAWAGSLVGTLFAHWLAVTVAKKPVQRLFGEHRLLRQMKNNDSVTTLLRLRVMPVAPFAVLGYIAGVAGVSLRRLLVATALGVLPSVIAYSWVGAELLHGITSPGDASTRALWVAGTVTLLLLLISIVPGIVHRLRG